MIDKGHCHTSCLQTCSHDGHVAGRLKGDRVSPTELPTALIHREQDVRPKPAAAGTIGMLRQEVEPLTDSIFALCLD
jgi:hypothetical protein